MRIIRDWNEDERVGIALNAGVKIRLDYTKRIKKGLPEACFELISGRVELCKPTLMLADSKSDARRLLEQEVSDLLEYCSIINYVESASKFELYYKGRFIVERQDYRE